MTADGCQAGIERIVATGRELQAALDRVGGVDGGFSVLLRCDEREPGELGPLIRSHAERLARACVGVAVVAGDPELRAKVVGYAGQVPFPLTALATEQAASGWLDGQEAVGLVGVRPAGGSRTVGLPPVLVDYVEARLNPGRDHVAARLARRTVNRYGSGAGMNIGEDQGRLLRLLVELVGARRAVEVGTFTGMSSLWIARGLPVDGSLTCLEIDDECLELAREAWAEAGVAHRITAMVGPALGSLEALAAGDSRFDFAFIDADKENYLGYLDALLPLVRSGGLVCVDNTLWSGAVVDPRVEDPATLALRAFNDAVAARSGVESVMLTVGDGLTVIRKL